METKVSRLRNSSFAPLELKFQAGETTVSLAET